MRTPIKWRCNKHKQRRGKESSHRRWEDRRKTTMTAFDLSSSRQGSESESEDVSNLYARFRFQFLLKTSKSYAVCSNFEHNAAQYDSERTALDSIRCLVLIVLTKVMNTPPANANKFLCCCCVF